MNKDQFILIRSSSGRRPVNVFGLWIGNESAIKRAIGDAVSMNECISGRALSVSTHKYGILITRRLVLINGYEFYRFSIQGACEMHRDSSMPRCNLNASRLLAKTIQHLVRAASLYDGIEEKKKKKLKKSADAVKLVQINIRHLSSQLWTIIIWKLLLLPTIGREERREEILIVSLGKFNRKLGRAVVTLVDQ